MRFTIGVLFLGILSPAFAQSSPDPNALLARQADELQHHRTYEFTQDMSMTMNMPGMTMPAISYTMVTKTLNLSPAPSKMRMETEIPGMGAMQIVSDGKQTWTYVPLLKQYTKTEDGAASAVSLVGGLGMASMPDVAGLIASSKVTGSEILEVDGQQHDCWVVESRAEKLAAPQQTAAMQDAVLTYWIDKSLGLQLKMSLSGKVQGSAAAPPIDMHMVMTMHSMKFDENLPDSLFEFTPPADAKESDALFPGMPAAPAKTPAKAAPKPAATGEPEAFVPNLHPIQRIEPAYPAEARDKHVEGFVRVLITLDSTGGVSSAEPLTGPDALRSAALNAVKQWRFHPVLRDGHPVAAYTEAMLDFFSKSDSEVTAADLKLDLASEMTAQQRIQELTTKFPRTPQQVLADTEDQQRGAAGFDRLAALPQLAQQALDAGELAQASSYATELLQTTKDAEETYTANTVLGLVALRQGSLSQARQYLLESSKITPPIDFGPLGPDLTLARELLAKGERDAVLEFLTQCKASWKSGAAQLDAMIETVRSGKPF